jgi:thioredoxin reductase (NADPH)
MANPVIMAVDDDRSVLNAIQRDLRYRYGRDYRIVAADSGTVALDTLKQLKVRSDPVALLVVDQRMPGMTGVEFLAQAVQLIPETKRVLLTAYADTEAAIRAINEVHLDHYLMKPWDPPEERLYPVLEDLLGDWQASFRPPFEGVRVLGHRWSPEGHSVRDFLARNQVPYRWLDVETAPEAQELMASLDSALTRLPLVILPHGERLVQPTHRQLAESIGLKTQAEMPFYDFIIVGGGPAGLAAAVYGASEGLRTLLIEREAPGGQAGMSSRIENYLGFPVGLSGADLARRAAAQASRFGAEILTPQEAVGLRMQEPYCLVTLADGTQLSCHALLIATGVSYRQLKLPGIQQLTGAGVYYGAAITEALSCRDRDVYVVGGGNSAGQAAMYLSRYASRVTILVRGFSVADSMSRYLIDQIGETENIDIKECTEVIGMHGEGHLEALTLLDNQRGGRRTVPASALFIFIGAVPHTDWLGGVVERDEYGFILSGPDLTRGGRRPRGWRLDREPYWLETSQPGVFVAGDVRHASVKRVASAVGEGSMAVQFIHQHLSSL